MLLFFHYTIFKKETKNSPVQRRERKVLEVLQLAFRFRDGSKAVVFQHAVNASIDKAKTRCISKFKSCSDLHGISAGEKKFKSINAVADAADAEDGNLTAQTFIKSADIRQSDRFDRTSGEAAKTFFGFYDGTAFPRINNQSITDGIDTGDE